MILPGERVLLEVRAERNTLEDAMRRVKVRLLIDVPEGKGSYADVEGSRPLLAPSS